jgi:hypothetical protein
VGGQSVDTVVCILQRGLRPNPALLIPFLLLT